MPEFPFIETCLALGTFIEPHTGYGTRVQTLPFNMAFDAGDNNDGITVLDITDLSQVKYAFVIPDKRGVCAQNFRNMPLTAYEYVAGYDGTLTYCESDDDHECGVPRELGRFLQGQTTIDNMYLSAPLIDEATLESV